MSRTYVIGLPVVITVEDDDTVHVSVDLSEADDLWEASTSEVYTDDMLRADAATIRAAVNKGTVIVDGGA